MKGDPRSRIPGVDTLLSSPELDAVVAEWGRVRVTEAVRAIQRGLREAGAGSGTEPAGAGGGGTGGPGTGTAPGWYAERVRERLERADRRSLRGVINATGVVLHTNLGRAPLAESARAAMAAAAGYAALEYDLEGGGRGSRHDHCVGLLQELTGAESALVVNNNAAAVVLALNTLAEGRSAIISRGELVEIGGSFRVPEIMARSGARMREVGSTNRTHPSDYRDALGPGSALILKVDRSNFRVEGFTAEVEVRELAALAGEAGIPLVHDQGSGALIDFASLGLPTTPTARDSLEAGADVVTMSGDKLLGGPQAGIVVGRSELIDAMRRNPLGRALRPDKVTLAALEATLALYRDPETARREIPVLRMLGASADSLQERGTALARRLRADGVEAEAVAAASAVGGGSYPGLEIPGTAVAVAGPPGATALARRLRVGSPPVVGRIREGRLLLDPRTVEPEREDELVAAVVAAVAQGGAE